VRVARFTGPSGEEIGVVRDDRVVPLAQLGHREQSVPAVLAGGQSVWVELERLAAQEQGHALADVTLLAPVPRPPKFLAVGMNSPDHAAEMQTAPRNEDVLQVLAASEHLRKAFPEPRFPVLFNKQTNCVAGPADDIWIPHDSTKLDYEGEVAVVIGRRLRRAGVEEAEAAIGGYTVTNDVSVRDWQWETSQMWLGKSFDTHGPTGPWVVTADEFDPSECVIRTWVNGDMRQEGRLSEQTLSPAEIVAMISEVCTLEAGDLIATGTPGGIGGLSGRYLVSGDVVRVEAAGIGELVNCVVAEPVLDSSAVASNAMSTRTN